MKQPSVIIVGGGVIGLTCAHYLSKSGLDTTVIDRESMGGACSYANCGYVCPSHVLPLTLPDAIPTAVKSIFQPKAAFKIKPQFNMAFWSWMIQFAKRCKWSTAIEAGHHLKAILDSSMQEYDQLMAEEKLDCEWKRTGLLYVFQTNSALDDFGRSNDLQEEHFQAGARRVNGEELLELDSTLKPNLAGGFFHENDASLNPNRLNRAWIESLSRRGVKLIEDCELQRVIRNHSAIAGLETSQGKFTADHYVFAMGAWSSKWEKQLSCKIPIQPGKGYSVTLAKPERSPTLPMLFPEKKVGISPFQDGFRIGSMMEFVGFNKSIPRARIEQLKDSVVPFLNFDLPTEELENWYGWRPMTWDTVPVIGPIPKLQNSYLATGHSMLGVSMAPATGRLIAEMILNQTPHIETSAFAPSRFN